MKTPISSENIAAETGPPRQISKKCPECYHYLSLEAQVCPTCGARVGKVDRFGMARLATNWKSYLVCILAWVGLGLYVRWAFL